MAENRPLFDDEDLPAWLIAAGITYAGETDADDVLRESYSHAGELKIPWQEPDPDEHQAPLTSLYDYPEWMITPAKFESHPEALPHDTEPPWVSFGEPDSEPKSAAVAASPQQQPPSNAGVRKFPGRTDALKAAKAAEIAAQETPPDLSSPIGRFRTGILHTSTLRTDKLRNKYTTALDSDLPAGPQAPQITPPESKGTDWLRDFSLSDFAGGAPPLPVREPIITSPSNNDNPFGDVWDESTAPAALGNVGSITEADPLADLLLTPEPVPEKTAEPEQTPVAPDNAWLDTIAETNSENLFGKPAPSEPVPAAAPQADFGEDAAFSSLFDATPDSDENPFGDLPALGDDPFADIPEIAPISPPKSDPKLAMGIFGFSTSDDQAQSEPAQNSDVLDPFADDLDSLFQTETPEIGTMPAVGIDLPDFSDLLSEAEASTAGQSSSTPNAAADTSDWFSEAGTDADLLAELPDFAAFGESSANAEVATTEAKPSGDDVPDWFKEIPAAPAIVPTQPAQPVLHPSALTDEQRQKLEDVKKKLTSTEVDWLTQSVMLPMSDLVEAPSAPVEDVPDWMSDSDAAGDLVGNIKPTWMQQTGQLAAAELPEWMREMSPTGSKSHDEATPPAAPVVPNPPSAPQANPAPGELGGMDWLTNIEAAEAAPLQGGVPLPNREAMADAHYMSLDDLNFDSLDLGGEDIPGFEETSTPPPAPQPVSASKPPPPPAKPTPPPSKGRAGGSKRQTDEFSFDLDLDTLLNLPASGALAELNQSEDPAYDLADRSGGYNTGDGLDDLRGLDLDSLLGPAGSEDDLEAELPPALSAAEFDQQLAQVTTGAQPASPPAPERKAPTRGGRERTPKVGAVPVPAITTAEVRAMEGGPVTLQIGDKKVKVDELPLALIDKDLQAIRDQFKALRPVESVTPTSGPLSGIAGALNPSDALLPQATNSIFGIVTSDLQARRVAKLSEMLSEQEDILKRRLMEEDAREALELKTKKAAPAQRRIRAKPDRLLITLILAFALLVPFFTDKANLVQRPDMNTLSVAERERYNAVVQMIDVTQSGQPVLVAFEYGPTAAGELDDLARVVLRDLLRKGARPVIVSTNPAGAIHAQGLMATMSNDPNELRVLNNRTAPLLARTDYVVLRYLPGGAAGVHALVNALYGDDVGRQVIFGADIEAKPSELETTAVDVIRSMPAFIVAETPEDVRNWAEQYRSSNSTAQGELRMVILSSAAASAAAQAYSDNSAGDTQVMANRRIIGPLVGLRDALIFETARNVGTGDKATQIMNQRWQSIGLTSTVSALIILLGALINGLRGLRRRAKKG